MVVGNHIIRLQVHSANGFKHHIGGVIMVLSVDSDLIIIH